MRLLLFSSVATVVCGARLTLDGQDSKVVFKQSNAYITAACNDNDMPYVAYVNLSGVEDPGLMSQPVSTWVNNLPISCVGQKPETPCATETGTLSFPSFWCEWKYNNDGGEVYLDGPHIAQVFRDTSPETEATLGYSAQIHCQTPTPAQLTKVTGVKTGDVTLTIKHYFQTGADSNFAADAASLPYQGAYGGNVLDVKESMIIHPPPPQSPPLPMSPPLPRPPPSPLPLSPNNVDDLCMETSNPNIYACISSGQASTYSGGTAVVCQLCTEKTMDNAWTSPTSQNHLFTDHILRELYFRASGQTCVTAAGQAGTCGWHETMSPPQNDHCPTPQDCTGGINWHQCAYPTPSQISSDVKSQKSHVYGLCKKRA